MADLTLKNTSYLQRKDEIDRELLEEHDFPVAPGDYLVASDPNGGAVAYKVLDVYYEDVVERYEHGKKLDEPRVTGEQIKLKIKGILGHAQGNEREWKLSEATHYGYVISKTDPREYKDEAIREYVFGDGFTTPYDQAEETISEETSLARLDESYLSEHKKSLLLRKNHLQAKFGIVQGFLDQKRSEFLSIKRDLQEQISKVSKIIHTLELYLGIGEDIEKIQEGPDAPKGTPVTFRQRIVYMDEEVADPEYGGLDFTNVGDFYDWLVEYNEYWEKHNYQVTIPEERCVLAVQIRREDKDYSDNPFVNFKLNMNNKQTCFLIRNGENLHAVWADTRVSPRLFPAEDELLELQERLLEDNFEWASSREKLEKKLENQVFKYKMYILVLQGLIERTDIFGREFNEINLLDINLDNTDKVKFIYDDSQPQLRNPYTDYKNWKEKINNKIEEGTRILFRTPKHNYYGRDGRMYWRQERKPFYNGERSIPDPEDGIYSIEERVIPNVWRGESEKTGLFFKYLPQDELWDKDYGFHQRKRRESFRIFPSDDFVINYDLVYEEDLEMLRDMIYDRVNRKDYLSSIPMLLELIEQKQKELSDEGPFWHLVANEVDKELNGGLTLSPEERGELILEYVKPTCRWWKLKNKWTRSLESDDSKALRMVKKEVIKRIQNDRTT